MGRSPYDSTVLHVRTCSTSHRKNKWNLPNSQNHTRNELLTRNRFEYSIIYMFVLLNLFVCCTVMYMLFLFLLSIFLLNGATV